MKQWTTTTTNIIKESDETQKTKSQKPKQNLTKTAWQNWNKIIIEES